MKSYEEWRKHGFTWHFCHVYPGVKKMHNVICYCGETFRAHSWQAVEAKRTLPQGRDICPTCFFAWQIQKQKQ